MMLSLGHLRNTQCQYVKYIFLLGLVRYQEKYKPGHLIEERWLGNPRFKVILEMMNVWWSHIKPCLWSSNLDISVLTSLRVNSFLLNRENNWSPICAKRATSKSDTFSLTFLIFLFTFVFTPTNLFYQFLSPWNFLWDKSGFFIS